MFKFRTNDNKKETNLNKLESKRERESKKESDENPVQMLTILALVFMR
jgi:hypothetical protein